jgi:SAM-dependent methyltransferase
MPDMRSDRLAETWDAHWDLSDFREYAGRARGFHYDLIARRLRHATNSHEIQTVLEAGAGTGLTSAGLARGGKCVTLVDISPRACAISRRGYESSGIRANVVRADAFELPFPDDCFDLVWNHGVIEHFDNPPAMVMEMARATRPGGWTVVLVPRTMSWWVLQKKIVGALTTLGIHHGWSRGYERSYTAQQLLLQMRHVPAARKRVVALYAGSTFSISEILRGIRWSRRDRPRNLSTQQVQPLSHKRSSGLARRFYRTIELARRSAWEGVESLIPAVGSLLGQELLLAIQKPSERSPGRET